MVCHDADPVVNVVVVITRIVVVHVDLSPRLGPDAVDVRDAHRLRLLDDVARQQKLALGQRAPTPRRRLVVRDPLILVDLAGSDGGGMLLVSRLVLQLADQPLHAVGVALAVVEVVEVGNDHRHWQRYRENAGDGTQRADQLLTHGPAPATAQRCRPRVSLLVSP